MNKNLAALIAATTIILSSSAFAAPTAIQSGSAIASTGTGSCAVLGDSVKLNLSKGVNGAYDCSEANNAINVGACHTAGSRGTTLTCAQVGMSSGTNPVAVYNNPGCTAANVGQDITVTTPSYRGFRASTTGGSVGAQSLSANCSASTALELVNFQ
ncbi:hypothetical protein [Stutzerimonas xanthomarina]|uniref:hypothetical protein n=1 Tax=Stutzerimonas xanthomarina TaxID=271420 RepID=UPI00190AAD73|nr:hypothetical protein [Stutzerimonas xanthomarina]MBK3845173.1 hypothetical protein [Stutzerimonas xanthomarina]MBK3846390.1 hypothetical protein [Stutzerimonas xanthomarina]